MSTVIVQSSKKEGPGCLVSALWFIFVGWWASQIVVVIAWLCMLSVVGIPLGIMLINKLPKIVGLREPGEKGLQVTVAEGVTVVHEAKAHQSNMVLRVVYFLLIGWWLSAVVMELAWAFCLSIIGMPIGFWLFDRVPSILSLHKS